LNSNDVKYLVVGGYAVGFYGYPRPTGDIDIWVMISKENALKIVNSLEEFGFSSAKLSENIFLEERKLVRLGNPPLRIELMTSATGVSFEECYERKVVAEIDGVKINFISLNDLKRNKKAIGAHKDLNDLEKLP
jgi:hypothetical protein